MPTGGFKRLLSHWSRHSRGYNDTANLDTFNVDLSSQRQAALQPKEDEHCSEPVAFVMDFFKLVYEVTKLVLFSILRILFLVFFAIYQWLNGTRAELRNSKEPENYERSARVMNIVYKYKYDKLVILNSVSDFILKHEGFVHPRKVLADNISLYDVNETEASFVEAPPGVEVWRSRYNSFHSAAQFNQAYRVYILPIQSFYKLANEIGDPEGKLVFMTNTARCGSTLLSRIFEETDKFVSLSEPTTVNYLTHYVGREDETWVQKHARATLRMLCKPTHLKNYAIKITPTATSVVPLLKRVYPDASHMFIYRDGLPVCKSLVKIWTELPMGLLNVTIARMVPQWLYMRLLNLSRFYDQVGNQAAGLKIRHCYGIACLYWGNIIGVYRKFRKNGHKISAIKYEDLVKDKEFTIKCIFEYCGISLEFVQPALRAFETDSQANSLISRKILKNRKLPELTQETRKDIDEICDYYEVARLGQSCVLEGTLTRALSN